MARSGGGARGRLLLPAPVAVLVLAVGCGADQPGARQTSTDRPSETAATTDTTALPTVVDDLPGVVAETRVAIVEAASERDYDALEPIVQPEAFLSDFGFGVDPLPRWRKQGEWPLEAMAVLLSMPYVVRETNEGTLYQWPRFTADSDPGDLSAAERDGLSSILDEGELEQVFQPEPGYFGPRLGILADGTWWFFLRGGEP